METLLQQTVNGLVVGSVYALIALGYTMVYGILGLINFAHGDVLMAGALVALEAIGLLQIYAPELGLVPTLLAGLSISVVVCMILGHPTEPTAYRRLRNAPRLAPLITAIGVSFLLQTLAMIIWGRNYHSFPQLVSTEPLEPIAGLFITPVQITILAVSDTLVVALVLLVMLAPAHLEDGDLAVTTLRQNSCNDGCASHQRRAHLEFCAVADCQNLVEHNLLAYVRSNLFYFNFFAGCNSILLAAGFYDRVHFDLFNLAPGTNFPRALDSNTPSP